jgi:hypothetical protein
MEEDSCAGCSRQLFHYSSSYRARVSLNSITRSRFSSCTPPNAVQAVKSRKAVWAAHVARKLSWEGTTFILPKGHWEDNIKTDMYTNIQQDATMVSCFIERSLHMFRALSAPIIRSTLTAVDSHWYNNKYITLDREFCGNVHFKCCPKSGGWSHNRGWVLTQPRWCDTKNNTWGQRKGNMQCYGM